MRPTSIARSTPKQLLASTIFTTLSPSARGTVSTISSVRPGHSSRPRPHSEPTLNLKASNPFSSRRRQSLSASSAGVMSRFIDEAYARNRPGVPPIRLVTGLQACRPKRSHNAVSKPASARRTYDPGNLCSRSCTNDAISKKSTTGSLASMNRPITQGATCRCSTCAVMSAW